MREYTTTEIDKRFALLDRYERRRVIQILQESETGHVSIRDVVSDLQKRDPTAADHDRIEVELHHIHLPKLTSLDAIEFDSCAKTIRYRGDELVEALLETAPETDISDA